MFRSPSALVGGLGEGIAARREQHLADLADFGGANERKQPQTRHMSSVLVVDQTADGLVLRGSCEFKRKITACLEPGHATQSARCPVEAHHRSRGMGRCLTRRHHGRGDGQARSLALHPARGQHDSNVQLVSHMA